jgi:multicomponent Na+:H+ antiporter subunit F
MSGQELAWDVLVALNLLAAALVLSLARLVRGPTLADRVVALELMGMLSVGVVAAYAVGYGEAFFVRVATVVALVSFLGTVAFAFYIERRGRP